MSLSEVLSFSEDGRKNILANYGRTIETVRNDIANIKEWFKKQLHLPEIPSDRLIENFLIINKFRIETSKEKLDNYYSVRSIMPEIFDKKVDVTFLRSISDVLYVFPLPQLTSDLYRIVITKFRDTNPDHFDSLEMLVYCLYHIDIRLREDCNLSLIYIVDCQGLTSSHLMKLSPGLLRKMAFISQRVTTNRMHGIHLINVPSLAESFINFIKTFLNSKLSSRIVVHINTESLSNCISLKNLPKDYGGSEKSLEELNEQWKIDLVDHLPKFISHRKLRVKEELRTREPYLKDEFGISGNFRKLTLD